MSLIINFLLWLEERQIGILTTIALHLFIICAILILKIRTNTGLDYSIMIDLSQINPNIEELLPEENQQEQINVQDFQQAFIVRNIPVNVADQRATESIDRMIREIKAEENIIDPKPPQDVPAETAPKNDPASEKNYDDKFPLNAAGERTIYRGPTTVSYELVGRRHTWMPAPVYKCRSGGTIVVNIVVNGNGYVIAAEINKSKSDSEDPCLVSAAKRDAERSRFNEASLARQQGSITYIFQPQ